MTRRLVSLWFYLCGFRDLQVTPRGTYLLSRLMPVSTSFQGICWCLPVLFHQSVQRFPSMPHLTWSNWCPTRGCHCPQFCFLLSWKWQKRRVCRPLNSFQTLTSRVGCIFVDAERINKKKKKKETVSSVTHPNVNTWILSGS